MLKGKNNNTQHPAHGDDELSCTSRTYDSLCIDGFSSFDIHQYANVSAGIIHVEYQD